MTKIIDNFAKNGGPAKGFVFFDSLEVKFNTQLRLAVFDWPEVRETSGASARFGSLKNSQSDKLKLPSP